MVFETGMSQKPSIQLHLPDLYIGGIERWALTLMNGLPDFEWLISTPAAARAHGAAQDEFRRFRIVDEGDASARPDALIATWGLADQPVRPTIAVAHSAFPKYREMMQAVRYDHAVAVSTMARACFPPETAVEIIHNGVDLQRLEPYETRAETRRRLGVPVGATVVGYVGRWGYQKNPLAAARAAGTIPGGLALYVGPTPDDPALLAEAQACAPCLFVTPDRASPIGDVYRAMDLCVFASRSEGFGLAIAEAWACGTPVAATRVGVVAEHPDLAILLPDEPDVAALRLAVETALAPGGEARVHAAKATVECAYSADVMIRRWRGYILDRLNDAASA
jgi:glycosyltransferase involved in cell wall biosynthesis